MRLCLNMLIFTHNLGNWLMDAENLPIILVVDDIKLLLNVGRNLLFAFKSETLSDQSNSELMSVHVVRELFDELSLDVSNCIHCSTICLHFTR